MVSSYPPPGLILFITYSAIASCQEETGAFLVFPFGQVLPLSVKIAFLRQTGKQTIPVVFYSQSRSLNPRFGTVICSPTLFPLFRQSVIRLLFNASKRICLSVCAGLNSTSSRRVPRFHEDTRTPSGPPESGLRQ